MLSTFLIQFYQCIIKFRYNSALVLLAINKPEYPFQNVELAKKLLVNFTWAMAMIQLLSLMFKGNGGRKLMWME